MALGKRLRKRREQLGMSQRELARRARIPQPTISDIERGVQEDITTALLKRLATELGCTTDYLVGMYEDDDDKNEDPVKAPTRVAGTRTRKGVRPLIN
jgi:transcriptional regulator with XRE-family HTH domain